MLLLFASSQTALPSTVKRLTMGDMVRESALIFEGQVTSVDPRLDANTGRIHSYVTFQILDTIKGAPGQSTVELSFLGGTVGDLKMEVSDLHIPERGERGIYFVQSTSKRMVNPLSGWDQGHFLIVTDTRNGFRVTTRSGLRISELTPGETKPGFSIGTASGVRIAERDSEIGLDVSEFKEKLRSIVVAAQ